MDQMTRIAYRRIKRLGLRTIGSNDSDRVPSDQTARTAPPTPRCHARAGKSEAGGRGLGLPCSGRGGTAAVPCANATTHWANATVHPPPAHPPPPGPPLGPGTASRRPGPSRATGFAAVDPQWSPGPIPGPESGAARPLDRGGGGRPRGVVS